MASRNSGNVSDSTILEIRGELQGLRNEVASLRSQLARLTGAEAGPVQAMPQITTPGPEPYDQDPLHHPAVVAALLAGTDPRPAIRAAREQISAGITARGGQPAAVSEFELADVRRRGNGHEQRQALSRAGLDLTDLDSRGGTVSRDEDTGQVTVNYARQPGCPNGHAAEHPDDRFCAVCGSPVAAPGLGEQWQDELDQARQQNQRIAAGLSEEG
jgi:hypothetical protein